MSVGNNTIIFSNGFEELKEKIFLAKKDISKNKIGTGLIEILSLEDKIQEIIKKHIDYKEKNNFVYAIGEVHGVDFELWEVSDYFRCFSIEKAVEEKYKEEYTKFLNAIDDYKKAKEITDRGARYEDIKSDIMYDYSEKYFKKELHEIWKLSDKIEEKRQKKQQKYFDKYNKIVNYSRENLEKEHEQVNIRMDCLFDKVYEKYHDEIDKEIDKCVKKEVSSNMNIEETYKRIVSSRYKRLDKNKIFINYLKYLMYNISYIKNKVIAYFNLEYDKGNIDFNGLDAIQRLSLYNMRDASLKNEIFNINLKQDMVLTNNKESISLKEFYEKELKSKDKPITYGTIMGNLKDYKVSFIQKYELKDIIDLLNVSLYQIIINKIVILKCKNCHKFFIPKSKENEKYCDNIYNNNKTCKQLAYEIKLKNSEIDKIYRTAYKTQNARKQRYSVVKGIEKDFENWAKTAKEQLQLVKDGKLSKEEFKDWIKSNSI